MVDALYISHNTVTYRAAEDHAILEHELGVHILNVIFHGIGRLHHPVRDEVELADALGYSNVPRGLVTAVVRPADENVARACRINESEGVLCGIFSRVSAVDLTAV